jgi:hypothetical protein
MGVEKYGDREEENDHEEADQGDHHPRQGGPVFDGGGEMQGHDCSPEKSGIYSMVCSNYL